MFSAELQEDLPEIQTDEVTGQVLPENALKNRVNDLNAIIEQARLLNEMTNTKGWSLVKKFIDSQIESLINLLKVEKDYNKIVRIQSELLAFETLPMLLEKSFYDAEEANQRLIDLLQ